MRDSRGSLTVLEKTLPFQVVRSYWIYGVNGTTRGGHRHTKTIQALVAVSGEVEVYLSDGINEETIILKRPSQCLLVEAKDWHTMTIYDGSILLVMASTHFDKNDYVATAYAPIQYD